jgi:cytochrome c-type biogenesis protein CcmE
MDKHDAEKYTAVFGSHHAQEQRARMTRKQRRLTIIGGSLAVLAVAAALVLNAMRDSIVFFSTPSMVAEKHIQPGRRFRLGGLVQRGSLVRGDNLAVTFLVADGSATLSVTYKGILPDLFREGQGVVAEGALDPSGVFRADTVLAKHDETYMPKDVADALKKQGHWKDDYGAKPNYNANSAGTEGASRAAQGMPLAAQAAPQANQGASQ